MSNTTRSVKMDGSWARWGDFKLFEMSKRVEDDIPDRLLQWLPSQSIDGGTLTQVEDPMLARRHVGESSLRRAQGPHRPDENRDEGELHPVPSAHGRAQAQRTRPARKRLLLWGDQ